MSPSEIVRRALAAGLDGIALTDHQTAKNTPAIAECARRAGIRCLFGLEVQTAEEVHTVALFDTVEQALAMTEWVYAAMPKRVNDPETFGDQPVVTWDDDIVEMEWRILAMGCRHAIPETAAKVHELGGLYIAAHVDRPNFSVFGALGEIPAPPSSSIVNCQSPIFNPQSPIPNRQSTIFNPQSPIFNPQSTIDNRQSTIGNPQPPPYFDAVELSRTADESLWLPKVAGYAVTRSSDAHNLDDVARVWTEAEGEFSVAGLRAIFADRRTKISPRLTSF